MNLICYADDIVLASPSANGLQFLMDKISSLLTENGLMINVEKSSYVVFGSKNSIRKFHRVVLALQRWNDRPTVYALKLLDFIPLCAF